MAIGTDCVAVDIEMVLETKMGFLLFWSHLATIKLYKIGNFLNGSVERQEFSQIDFVFEGERIEPVECN